jgi:hypothetical protein
MDWTEYSVIADAFRTRFGQMAPSMFTPEGAMEYMRRALRGQSDWPDDEPNGPTPNRIQKKD